ncbi:PTS system transporter subunit IIA [Streptococcus varani]|uniref:phosphoenolpyruvate--glycerone phosphotransferase n=1 Tax=Streptococcus varani TaxID=1608583 RepID=A0A0E4CRT1_9STRE|nr:dihydroxyacetone kinase phosphoryl donor subunit DhaM [Streptococcus varani]CQR23733.1 PTS system transporter subunit IIA [Streptococcus varani]
MKGIILVSHSEKISLGLKEMLEEMVDSSVVDIISAGGTGDGRLGTNAVMIYDSINTLEACEDIYIFADIGSSILSSETAMDMLDSDELRAKVTLFDAPLIEGAFIGVVQASIGASTNEILEEISLNK